MRANYTYLYQIKSSKNYFFRIRTNIFKNLCNYPLASGHFVASLKTTRLDEALWLATFIKRHVMEDVQMMTHRISNIQLNALRNLHGMMDSTRLDIDFKSFIKNSFNHWLDSGKRMIQLGVISSEHLATLRTVPEQTILQVFDTESANEIPVTVHQDTIKRFEAESVRLGASLNPRKQEALMVNRLIAEFQKLARKNDNFDPAMVSDTPDADFLEGFEFLQLMETLKHFTASFRRAERKVESERNAHLQLGTCIDQFCIGKFQEVDSSAQQQYRTSFKMLRDLLGEDILVTTVDRECVLRVREHVQSLPSGRQKRGQATTLSVKSVNKYISNCHSLFEWLIETKKCIRDNPFSGMMLKLRENLHQDKRRQFTTGEITAIMQYQIESTREARTFRDAAMWAPKIAIYSGMRLNEICSLHVRDIYQIDGIWVFDTQNHRIKNQTSRRIVPVHSQLIARGLLYFVERQKDAGHFVLFPELQTDERMTSRDGLGEPVSKWFNRTLLDNIGVNKNLERDHHLLVDFHCTRTTVACKFKNRGVSSYQAKALLGHVEDDVTFGDYAGGENVGLDVLQRVVEMLDY